MLTAVQKIELCGRVTPADLKETLNPRPSTKITEQAAKAKKGVRQDDADNDAKTVVTRVVISKPVTLCGGTIDLQGARLVVRMKGEGRVRLEKVRIEGSGLRGLDWERMNGMVS